MAVSVRRLSPGSAGCAGAAAPRTSKTGKFTGTLRVITLGVELPTPEVAKKIKAGPRLQVALTATDPVTEAQKAITAPETFDIFGGYNYQDIQVWSSHHLMPVDTTKITAWPQLYKLFAWGKVHPGSKRRDVRRRRRAVPGALPQAGHERAAADEGRPEVQQGHRPVDTNEATGKTHGGSRCRATSSARPAHFNADSVGYNADVLTKAPNQVGWQELLNKKWKGKVALLKDPGIVMQDIGNALKALGHLQAQGHGQHDDAPRSTAS